MKITTKELKERWKAETPDFWKKVQKIGGVAFVAGAVVVALPASLVTLPAWLVGLATFAMNSGATVAGISQLTKK